MFSCRGARSGFLQAVPPPPTIMRTPGTWDIWGITGITMGITMGAIIGAIFPGVPRRMDGYLAMMVIGVVIVIVTVMLQTTIVSRCAS